MLGDDGGWAMDALQEENEGEGVVAEEEFSCIHARVWSAGTRHTPCSSPGMSQSPCKSVWWH